MSKTRKVPSLILLAAASIALTFGVAGCGKNDTQQTAQNQPAQTDQSQDPAAAANLAPTDATQATGTNQQQPASQPAQQTYQQPALAACAVESELSTACSRAGTELFR